MYEERYAWCLVSISRRMALITLLFLETRKQKNGRILRAVILAKL